MAILTDDALNSAFGNGTTQGNKSISTTGNIQGDNLYATKYYVNGSTAYITYNTTTGAIEFNT